MMKRSILCILMLAISATAQTTTPPQVDIVPDVVYGHKDGLALTFDVLKPKAKANGAAVIFMVSGGWVSSYSPPQQTALRFRDLLDKGFTVMVAWFEQTLLNSQSKPNP